MNQTNLKGHFVPQPLPLQLNDIAGIDNTFKQQKAAFAAAPYRNLVNRRHDLAKLINALRQYQDALAAAIDADFGSRSATETKLVDILGPILEAKHAINHLRKWMRASKRRTELLFTSNKAWVEYQPKGVVGIVATWNFPLYLSIGPLIAALAAGNRVMLKMSEYAPQATVVVAQMLGSCFGRDQVAVFGGDVHFAKEFCHTPFDHLIYTGSPAVGREVMLAAAANLTPVTLELGGKSPAIISPTGNNVDAAKRITHGKCFNAGQICVSPDYALVHSSQVDTFVGEVQASFGRMFPQLEHSADFTSIISERHYQRLLDILADAAAKGATVINCGGAPNPERKLPLHIVLGATPNMRVMQEELFGPLLPVITYNTLGEALAFIHQGQRPLALYSFGFNRQTNAIICQQTHSGGVSINDWGWHVFQHDMPFGGIGNSGMGTYHGVEGFRELSHAKAIYQRQRFFPVGLFYPPYLNWVQRLALWLYVGKSSN